jgi:CBS domain-containing protein
MKIGSIIDGKKVEIISPMATLLELVTSLTSLRLGALVVSTDGKQIEGIVSERDVIRALPDKIEKLNELLVRDLMTASVFTCTAEATVAELMLMMTENRVRHIPVVDDAGELVSIISIGDVVKYYVNELDTERQALRDYVKSGA